MIMPRPADASHARLAAATARIGQPSQGEPQLTFPDDTGPRARRARACAFTPFLQTRGGNHVLGTPY